MKGVLVHLMNKYFGCDVSFSGENLSVRKNGELLVCLMKNAHGVFEDRQDLGARDAYCLSPIPKNCRAHKLYKDDKIGKSEEYAERSKQAKQYVDKFGFVPCEEQLEKESEKYSLSASSKPSGSAYSNSN